MANPCRFQLDAKRAHASRSAPSSVATSARHNTGSLSPAPSACAPYTTTDRKRSANTLRRSPTSASTAGCHVGVVMIHCSAGFRPTICPTGTCQ